MKTYLVKECLSGFIFGNVRVDSLPKNAVGRHFVKKEPKEVEHEVMLGILVEEKAAAAPFTAPITPAIAPVIAPLA